MTRDEIPDVRVKIQVLRAEKRRHLWTSVALWLLGLALGGIVLELTLPIH